MTAENSNVTGLYLFKGKPPPPGDPPELEAPPLPVGPPEPEPDPPEPEVFPDSLRDDTRVRRLATALVAVLMFLVVVLGATIVFLLRPPSAPPPAASVAPPDVHIQSVPVSSPVRAEIESAASTPENTPRPGQSDVKLPANIAIHPTPSQALTDMARWLDDPRRARGDQNIHPYIPSPPRAPRRPVAPRRHREITDLPVLHDTTACPLSICFVPLSQR
jgi:hypothetical protein